MLDPQQELMLRPSSQLDVCAQGGDCFDICTVLCSLLLGAGFDAYVVAGYAPLAVTVSDQTSAVCPLLEPCTPKAKPQKMQPAASQKQPVQPKEAKYQIKSDVKPESVFLQVHVSLSLHLQEQPRISHSAWVSLLLCQSTVHAALCKHMQAGHQQQLCCSSATCSRARNGMRPPGLFEGYSLHKCDDNNLKSMCCPLQTILVMSTCYAKLS